MENRLLFDKILNEIDESIVLIDENMDITYCNNAFYKCFHIIPQKLIEKNWGVVTGCSFLTQEGKKCGETIKCNSCIIRKHLKDSFKYDTKYKDIEFEKKYILNNKDKKKFFRFSVSPVLLDGKKQILLTINDITEISIKKNIIEEKLKIIEAKEKKIDFELKIATSIQQGFLPENNSVINNLRLSYRYVPSSELSGDFLDIIPLCNKKIGFLFADVMGHGIGASLITAAFKTTLRDHSCNRGKQKNNSPAKMMKILNEMLIGITPSVIIASVIYCIFDRENSKITYSVAGSEFPIFYSKKSDSFKFIDSKDTVLGIFNDYNFHNYTIEFKPDDYIFFLTDGIISERNSKDETYPVEKILNIIQNHKDLSSEKLFDDIEEDVKKYSNVNQYTDDVTMALLRWEN